MTEKFQIPPVTRPTAVFPKLADPEAYVPVEIGLNEKPGDPAYWHDLFSHQIDSITEHALETYGDTLATREKAAAVRERMKAFLTDLRDRPDAYAHWSLIDIDKFRDHLLLSHGFPDPHNVVKREENALALELLPGLLAELDGHDPGVDRLDALIRGTFAGNIFDLGVQASIEMFKAGGMDFFKTRDELPARPWLVDDFDALAERWQAGPHERAALLVDNAGADVVLGMIPFCRELLRRGTAVILSANTEPSLNDIIHDELVELMDEVAAIDEVTRAALASGQLELVGSGNDLPLLDLTRVAPEFAEACAEIDLIVLEGMGRAIETNHTAKFACDALKIGMAKDPRIAAHLGGRTYDVVCRFDRV